MGKRIQWEEPQKALGGLSPHKWLEARYPDAPRNQVLAAELAELLGIEDNLGTRMVRRASHWGLRKTEVAQAALNQYRSNVGRAPESPYLHLFEDWPTAEWDSFIVASDWHVPYYNQDLVERMMMVAKNWRPEPIKKLIIGGDFIDYSQLGIFMQEEEEPRRTLDDDLDVASDVLTWLTKWFEDVLVLKANHEARLARALGREISHDRWGKLYSAGLSEVHLSNWSYCVITDSTGAEWRITHPGRRWKNLGRLAQELANRYQMHTMLCHSHVMSLSYNISGDYICIDTGGMFAESAMGYYMKQDAAYWRWLPGFWVVDRGKVHAFNDLWTDWDHYWRALGVEGGGD